MTARPTPPRGRLPTFLVIGAMKAGTNSLHRYLADHPQVFVPPRKEIYFFSEEHNWSLGPDWYAQQFEHAGDALAVGEASTTYTMYPRYAGVPERIALILPDVRLVYLVRHPIERMRSHFLHNRHPKVSRGFAWDRERLPIDKALLRNPTYLQCSQYALQIEQYLAHFPRERMLAITSEDLRHDRETTMRRVYRFLGVDERWTSPVLDQEFHLTAERRVPRPLARTIRGIPGYGRLARWAPPWLRRINRRLTITHPDLERGKISEQLREQLETKLRDDVTRLRLYLDDGFDGWGIA